MEDKTFYDENKSTDKSVSDANNQTKDELVKHNQEVNKSIPTSGDTKAKDFSDVKSLMQFLNGGNTQYPLTNHTPLGFTQTALSPRAVFSYFDKNSITGRHNV